MPNIVRLWYKRHRGIDVEPFWGTPKDFDETSVHPFFMMPAEIAAEALNR
jgi:hypothetical protein